MIVCFQDDTPQHQMPSFSWLKRCYQMIDRRYEMRECSKNQKNSYTRKSLSLLFVCLFCGLTLLMRFAT